MLVFYCLVVYLALALLCTLRITTVSGILVAFVVVGFINTNSPDIVPATCPGQR